MGHPTRQDLVANRVNSLEEEVGEVVVVEAVELGVTVEAGQVMEVQEVLSTAAEVTVQIMMMETTFLMCQKQTLTALTLISMSLLLVNGSQTIQICLLSKFWITSASSLIQLLISIIKTILSPLIWILLTVTLLASYNLPSLYQIHPALSLTLELTLVQSVSMRMILSILSNWYLQHSTSTISTTAEQYPASQQQYHLTTTQQHQTTTAAAAASSATASIKDDISSRVNISDQLWFLHAG